MVSGRRKGILWPKECSYDCTDLGLSQKPITTIDPVLHRNENLMIVDADASLTEAGCVLSQIQAGKERVIAYHSHAFSREERNYCVTRRELLSVVIALKHFEPYLLFRKFAVRTDHSSLRWLQTLRPPKQQLFRWLAVLQTFDFEIYHRAGKLHQNCDSLSRRPCEENCKHCSRREQVGNDKIEDTHEKSSYTTVVYDSYTTSPYTKKCIRNVY